MKRVLAMCGLLLALLGCSAQPEPPATTQEVISHLTGASGEQSKNISTIIEDSGIIFEAMVADKALNDYDSTGGTGYWIKTPNVNEVRLYLTPDMAVYEIWYRKECIYREGEVLKLLYDAASGEQITIKEFEQIDTGMSYNKVKNIIGGPGELLSAVDLDIGSEYKTELYRWWGFNGNGSNAVITFQGDKVTAMAQSGLD